VPRDAVSAEQECIAIAHLDRLHVDFDQFFGAESTTDDILDWDDLPPAPASFGLRAHSSSTIE